MKCRVTHEELSALAAGDLPEVRAQSLRRHAKSCGACANCLAGLKELDSALAALKPVRPSAQAALATLAAVAEATGRSRGNEVMTLEEVSQYLKVGPRELGELMDELPAFELAGQIRVRRTALETWIKEKEEAYRRKTSGKWFGRPAAITLQKGAA